MKSDRPTAGVVMPPPLIYLIPLLAGFLVHRWVPLSLPLPTGVTRLLGFVFGALGFITLPAVMGFLRAGTQPEPWKPTTALVTSGVYRFSRNPMYLGFTLAYIGAALLGRSLWPILLLPVVMWVMHWGVIRREERYLEALFGDEYREYRRRVRRWF